MLVSTVSKECSFVDLMHPKILMDDILFVVAISSIEISFVIYVADQRNVTTLLHIPFPVLVIC